MKAIKRIISIIMSLMLVFGCTSTAFSAEATGSVTIQSTAEVSIANRTFEFYKIFNAEKSTSPDGAKITSYQWDVDAGTQAKLEEFFFGDGTNAGQIPGVTEGSIHDVADYIRSLEGRSSDFSKFATSLYNFIKTNLSDKFSESNNNYKKVTATAATLTVSDLSLGYYLIYDATENVGQENQVRSAVMLTTPGENKSIDIKADLPTINKTVMGNDNVEQKGTSSNIGDCAKYFIRATIPNHDMYSSYKFEIKDTLPDGLDFVNETTGDHAFSVKVGDTLIDRGTGYTFNYEEGTKTFTVDLLNAKQYANNAEVVVEYHAKVNINAKTVNTNTATLTYSSDPSDDTKYGTAKSSATVHLYQMVLTKYAEHTDGSISATRLAGAKFKLYRKGESDPITFRKVEETNASGKTFYAYYVDPTSDVTEIETVNDETYGDSNTVKGGGFADLKVYGLSEDEYELEETKAPEGYVVPNYRFQISIEDDIGKTSGAVTALSLKTTTSAQEGQTGGKIVNATFSLADHSVAASVTNATGSELPETGGIGTTLFTVIGIVLMAGALAFFTSRKRSSAV